MNRIRAGAIRCAFVLVALHGVHAVGGDPAMRELAYAPAPVDNPLKGLVPYAGAGKARWFPHSMEFHYLPLSALVVGEDRYEWTRLEGLLNDVAGRGHQAVFRVFTEYPGKKDVIPRYLVDQGLLVHRYTNTNTQPLPPARIETPDYADDNLRLCFRRFIRALGDRYDGDPRIGFITAGLLGTWGEWHTHPRRDLWASKEVQDEVLDAYEAAFRQTPILLRYPAGNDHEAQTPNSGRAFGYHDDSFAWATLDTGRKQDDWFFAVLLRTAGPEAVGKWKNQPIGGEIRPEAWGEVFDDPPTNQRIQDFAACVQATHASWLMDTGLFQKRTWTEARRRRAESLVRAMGYEFFVLRAGWSRVEDSLAVTVEVENRGVAPFYYEWTAELALLDPAETAAARAEGTGTLRGLLPGDPPRVWEDRIPLAGVAPGSYTLVLRVVNPLPNGIPLRFANETQDLETPGWLRLGPVRLTP